METAGKLLADFLREHPALAASLLVVVLVAVLVTNGIRMAWPVFAEMPRWARFILGLFDPLAANFWNIARRTDPEISGPLKKVAGEPNGP